MDVAKGEVGRFVDEELFAGRDRVTKQQAVNQARSRRLDPTVQDAMGRLPDREYTHDELVAALEDVSAGTLRSTFGT